jgi:SHS family sialic acid transporter-like MFS transporter
MGKVMLSQEGSGCFVECPPSKTMHADAQPTQKRLVLTMLAAFLGWMFDGMEMGIFPLVARPALQEMQAAQGIVGEQFVQTWMGIITALFLLGAAAGGLVFGWLGDKIGRVRAMTMSILCYSLFAGLSYFANAPWQLGALRFLGALGMGGEWSLGVALVMECWPAAKRPLMAGLIGAAANIGYCLIAVIAMNKEITQNSWRWVMLVGAAPAALTFLIRLFVPESEKWVASQEKGPSQPVREIFSGPLLRNTLLAICFSSVALIVTWGIVQWIPLWADKMAQDMGSHDKTIKAQAQLWQSAGAVLGSLAAPLLGLRFNRRTVYFGLCLGSLIICQVMFRQFHTLTSGFLMVAGLVGMFTAAFYGWLPQYLPELFPTRARATGQGLSFNFGRILAAIGAWQMGSVMQFFNKDYAQAGAAISFVYVIGMVFIWLAPETRGKPLPE